MKILIYYRKSQINDSGGPSGYLFNLFGQYDGDKIEFLPESKYAKNSNTKNFFKKAPKFIYSVLRVIYHMKYLLSLKKGNNVDLDFNKYDIIHFHDCFSYYLIRKQLSNYKGKILLTNHTPTSPQVEMYDFYLSKFENKFLKFERKIINDACEFAYKNCDYVVYPTLTADESYYDDRKDYGEIIKKKKVLTLLTGIREKAVNISREEVRKKYNISNDDFVFCYVGRHAPVKGYETFKHLFKYFKDDQKVKFLIAGKEGPLFGFKDDKWIEVGRTKDSGSIINAADCFVLPNKETYFDIVLLEVLSIGKPLITSFVGGNKYFLNKSKGILLYKDFDELVKFAKMIRKESQESLKEMGKLNKGLYYNEFTREKFLENYLDLVKKVVNNEL